MERSMANLLFIFLVTIIGMLVSAFSKESMFIVLIYLMLVVNTLITLDIQDKIKELKEQIKAKDNK